MSGCCSVYGCSNSRYKKDCKNSIRFFRFPKTKPVQKIWVKKCKRSDKINVKHAQICSRHFEQEDFEDCVKAQILGCLPKRLKSTAVPSVDLPGSTASESSTARSVRLEERDRQTIISSLLEKSGSTCTDEKLTTVPKCSNVNILSSKDAGASETLRQSNTDNMIASANITKKVDGLKNDINKLKNKNANLKKELDYKQLRIEELSQEVFILRNQYETLLKAKKTDLLQEEIKTILSPLFSETQIRALVDKKTASPGLNWTDDDISASITLYSLSPRCYRYLKDVKNYPLPSISTLNRRAKHFKGDTSVPSDTTSDQNDQSVESFSISSIMDVNWEEQAGHLPPPESGLLSQSEELIKLEPNT